MTRCVGPYRVQFVGAGGGEDVDPLVRGEGLVEVGESAGLIELGEAATSLGEVPLVGRLDRDALDEAE